MKNSLIDKFFYLLMNLAFFLGRLFIHIITFFLPLLRKNKKEYDLGIFPFSQEGSDGYTRRIGEYLLFFKESGIKVKTYGVCSNECVLKTLSKKPLYHYLLYAYFFWRRIFQIINARKCNAVFVQRNLFPYYPDGKEPYLEEFLWNICKNSTIDFWDAVWVTHPELTNKSIKFVEKVSVVNSFLYEYFKEKTCKVYVFPIGVNISKYCKKKDYQIGDKLVLFYTGSPSNVENLFYVLSDVFFELSLKFSLKLILVSRLPYFHPAISVEHHLFEESSFFELILKADIGVYAVENSDFSKGKMAMKVLDYMAAGLPCVASPYGLSPHAEPEENILVATTKEEWLNQINRLANNFELRKKIGENGRRCIVENHCLSESYYNFLSIIKA